MDEQRHQNTKGENLKTSTLKKEGWEFKQVKCWTLICIGCKDAYDEDGYSPHYTTKHDFLESLNDTYCVGEAPECPCKQVTK